MNSPEQDIKQHGIEETKFNRAVEAMIPVVEDDYAFFESFLMNEHPNVYNIDDDTALKSVHKNINGLMSISMLTDEGLERIDKDKWNEYVLEEAKRRVEG